MANEKVEIFEARKSIKIKKAFFEEIEGLIMCCDSNAS